jgi:starch synthase
MQNLRPDILCGVGSLSEFFFLMFCPRGSKYVIDWHGPYDKRWLIDIGGNTFRARVSYYLASFLLGRADMFLCDSEFIAQSLRKHFPNKQVVVTLNAVDEKFYNPAKKDTAWLAKKFSIAPGRPAFLFVGHLIRRKRPEIFVELARRIPDASFIMVGREGLYKKEDVARWKETAGNLTWVPSSISREDMPKLFASVSGFVFPSLEEPFGVAVIEAMASGATVVATRSGALPEIVEDGKAGFLVDLDGGGDGRDGGKDGKDKSLKEVERYEEALRKIIAGGPKIDVVRKQARARVESLFTWPSVIERYLGAFRAISSSLSQLSRK